MGNDSPQRWGNRILHLDLESKYSKYLNKCRVKGRVCLKVKACQKTLAMSGLCLYYSLNSWEDPFRLRCKVTSVVCCCLVCESTELKFVVINVLLRKDLPK